MNIKTYNTSILVDGCRELNITLGETQIEQFAGFYEMLIEKNKVMNLTAITDWDEAVTKHFLDSLLICKAFDLENVCPVPKDTGSDAVNAEHSMTHVLDLGTGAGFPGIPLKIAFPDVDITLADSLNKRISFLDEVIKELGLEYITAVHGRAEDLGKNKEYREMYDLTVSRAVANLSSLSEYCLPFVREGGYFISYKSTNIDTELKNASTALDTLGGSIETVRKLSIPGTDIERSFVIIKKVRRTPGKYPRRAGIPSKQPL